MSGKAIIVFAFALCLVVSSFSLAHAGADKGMRAYQKYMKKLTGINGARFAERHTQEEWRRLFANGEEEFKRETFHVFKDTADFLESDRFKKLWEHLRDFFIKYASDSGNIPPC